MKKSLTTFALALTTLATSAQQAPPLVGTWDCEPDVTIPYRIAFFGDSKYLMLLRGKGGTATYFGGPYETNGQYLLKDDAVLQAMNGQRVEVPWTSTSRSGYFRSRTFRLSFQGSDTLKLESLDVTNTPGGRTQPAKGAATCKRVADDADLAMLRREISADLWSAGTPDRLSTRIANFLNPAPPAAPQQQVGPKEVAEAEAAASRAFEQLKAAIASHRANDAKHGCKPGLKILYRAREDFNKSVGAAEQSTSPAGRIRWLKLATTNVETATQAVKGSACYQ